MASGRCLKLFGRREMGNEGASLPPFLSHSVFLIADGQPTMFISAEKWMAPQDGEY